MNSLLHRLSPLALAAVLAAPLAGAQAATAAPAAPAPTTSATAAPAPLPAPDPEKQKVIDQILAVFHPENGVLQAVQRQGVEAMQQSKMALQNNHVPQDRGEKALKDVGTDVQKYFDTTMPIAIASAKKNTSASVGPILAQNFSVDELRQLLAQLQSPLRQKFDKLVPEMETAVGRKVQAETATQINQNLKMMNDAVSAKLRAAITPQ